MMRKDVGRAKGGLVIQHLHSASPRYQAQQNRDIFAQKVFKMSFFLGEKSSCCGVENI